MYFKTCTFTKCTIKKCTLKPLVPYVLLKPLYRTYFKPGTVRTSSPRTLGKGMMMTLSTYILDIFDQIEGAYCEKSIRDGAFIDHRSER